VTEGEGEGEDEFGSFLASRIPDHALLGASVSRITQLTSCHYDLKRVHRGTTSSFGASHGQVDLVKK
jgi:hypothetical protein